MKAPSPTRRKTKRLVAAAAGVALLGYFASQNPRVRLLASELACRTVSPSSCVRWAGAVAYGNGTTADPQRAFHIVEERCSSRGERASCAEMGMFMTAGIGTPKDLNQPEALCLDSRPPVAARYSALCLHLGISALAGQYGPERQTSDAAALLTRACALGEKDACAMLPTLPRLIANAKELERLGEACGKGDGGACDALFARSRERLSR